MPRPYDEEVETGIATPELFEAYRSTAENGECDCEYQEFAQGWATWSREARNQFRTLLLAESPADAPGDQQLMLMIPCRDGSFRK